MSLNSDLYGGLVMLAFAGIFWLQMGDFTRFGLLFPKVIIAILGILGVVMIVKSKVKPQYTSNFLKDMNKYMVAVMVWSLIWVISIKYIGFFVASVASMWMIQWSLSSDRDLKSAVKFLAVSVGCVFVIYYTFTKYLYIFFPEGFLF